MKRRVLIIEDSNVDMTLLSSYLIDRYKVMGVSSGREGLSAITKNFKTLSAIFLDIMMPEMDGFEVLRKIGENPLWRHIPIIVTTSKSDEDSLDEALKLGATAYITKPYNQKILLKILKNVISLCEMSALSITTFKDKMTGLYNRETFFTEAAKLINIQEPRYYVLSYVNIEHFKLINEQYGQKTGDRVLRHIGECLSELAVNLDGIAARFNGDKFAILFPSQYCDSEEVELLHKKMTKLIFINQPLNIRIGRYLVSDLSLSVNTMYDRAILAESSIQDKYNLHVAEYTESMRESFLYEQKIVNSMEKALANREFETWFQPQYNHVTGGLIGAEALVRWRNSEDGNLIPPNMFIPVFEKNGFIYELDKYIWEDVCEKLRKWLDEGIEVVPVSVNISRVDLFNEELIYVLKSLIQEYRLPINLFRLEITESAFSEASDTIVSSVKSLIDYGFTVEIDDFGSGYSSLNTLKDVPAQILKLDMKFFDNTDDSGRSGNIIESIIRMAKWIGMSVIAEGVEDQIQADYLKSIGCYYIQGYLYSKPIPLAKYEDVLKEGKKEIKITQEFTVKKLDNTKFWDPKSMDTIMFNSYIGGAFIFEYRDGRIELLRINEKYKETLGKFTSTEGNLENLDIRNHLFGEDKQKFLDLITLSIECKNEVYENLCLKESENDNQNIEYVRLTIKVIAISDNNHLFYGVLENYTAQKLAEKKERKLSNKLESIMNYSPCGITAIILNDDAKTDFLLMNRKFCELLGYTEEQFKLEVKNGFDCIIAEDKDRVISEVSKLNQVGQNLQLDMRAERRDGKIIWLRCMLNVISMDDVDGAVQLSSFYDITSEKVAENHLEFVNESAQSIISYSDSNIAMNKILENLLSYFDADRAYIIEIDRDNNVLNNTYEICAENIKPRIQDVQNVMLSTTFSWIYKLEKNEFICYDKSKRLDNKLNKYYLNQYGITSLILAPLWQEESLIGYSAVENPKRLINQAENLVAMCSYISILISRRDYEKKLRNAEKELLDNLPCGAALYRYKDDRIDILHINKHYWELVNRKEDDYSDSSILKVVHNDDKDSIFQEIKAAIAAKREINIDVRILCGKNDYNLFHIQGIIKPVDDFYLLYTAYTLVSEKNMSLQELIPVALSLIMKSSTDMMFVKDIGLHYISASPSTYEIANCSNEREIIGKTDIDLFGKPLGQKYLLEDKEIIKTKCPKINSHDIIITKDGESHSVLTSKFPIVDENENIIGIYGLSRDITKTQQNESQLKTISNNIPGGIISFEFGKNHFQILYVNDVFFYTIGYSKEEYTEYSRENPFFFIHEDDCKDFKNFFLNYYKNPDENQYIKYEFRCKYKNGVYRWFSIRGNIEQIEKNKFRLNAVLIDIDEMKKTENMLLVSKEEYKVASQLSDNIICRYSIKHKTITLPSDAAKNLSLPEILRGVPDSEENLKTISPDTIEPYLNFYKMINEGKEKGFAIFRKCLPSGWKWISAKFLSIKNLEGASVSAIISFSDITELRDKEITYEKWNQNLKGRPSNSYTLFCCNIDKETIYDRRSGTLLTVQFDDKPFIFNLHTDQYSNEFVYEDDKEIFVNYLNSDNLRKEYENGNYSSSINFRENTSDGEYKWIKLTVDLVKDPATECIEAHMLFEDIDSIKRKELLIRERAENDPLTGILNRISFAEKVDNVITTSKPGEQHALLMLDIDYFKQINDVLGHTEGDKALIDIAKLLKSMARSYDLVGRLGGDEFFVFLQNIPNDIIAAKRAKAICEKTQKTYGEDIHISSSIGISIFPKNGKNFEQLYKKADQVLYSVKELGRNNFAFYGEHIEERIMQSSKMESVIKKKPHILIVEDNPVDYTLIAGLFDESYIVEHSKNGDEAIKFLRRYGHSISIILLDLIMPKMDGFEVLDRLKKDVSLKTIPVIVVSGDMRRETCLKAIRAGATDFITKPVDSELILQRVKAILEYRK